MRTIDLNCDLGEGFADDAKLIPLVSSVNIACGGHAGDDDTMRQAVRTARANGVNAGAHPGYEDRDHFGRIEVPMPAAAVGEWVRRQVERLRGIADAEGVRLGHVKLHGALYHVAAMDREVADAVIESVARIDRRLFIVGPPQCRLAAAADAAGLTFVAEGFVDRRYRIDGTLVPRRSPDAVFDDPAAAVRQGLNLAVGQPIETIDGPPIRLKVETLCLHGDGAHALAFLIRLREALAAGGIDVVSFGAS